MPATSAFAADLRLGDRAWSGPCLRHTQWRVKAGDYGLYTLPRVSARAWLGVGSPRRAGRSPNLHL